MGKMRMGDAGFDVEVHHVKARIAHTHLAHDGVHVGAVVVQFRTGSMNHVGDLQDVFLKQPQRIGIGQHQSGDRTIEFFFKVLKVDTSLRVALHHFHLETVHRRARRVCTMCGFRHQDRIPFRLSLGKEPCMDDLQASIFAMRPRTPLERTPTHARNSCKILQKVVHQRKATLCGRGVLQRVNGRERWHLCQIF